MPSLRARIRKLAYQGHLRDVDANRIINALDFYDEEHKEECDMEERCIKLTKVFEIIDSLSNLSPESRMDTIDRTLLKAEVSDLVKNNDPSIINITFNDDKS